jgi:hypothetical protein
MRLLLACVVVLLAPTASLFVTEGYVSALEGEFWQDASSQVKRLARVAELYPPNIRKMKGAPAIMQLKQMSSGQQVAATVCATPDSPYRRLFERLNVRCGDWTVYRRARWFAFLAAVAAAVTMAVILMARIAVQRATVRQRWSVNWTHWFYLRGIPAFLLCQVAISLTPYGVLLHSVTGRLLYANAILVLPFALLFWLERRFVLAFVEPHLLAPFQPKRAARVRRSRRSRHSQ